MDMGYSHKSWACPFCGGKPQIKYNYARFFFTDRQYKAIEAWNRRAGEEDKHENLD